jgi:glutamyl-tRNA reductase
MGQLLMVGLSHHAAPVEVRERVAVDESTWRVHAPRKLPSVLLSTCNRVEVYAWVDGRAQAAARTLVRALARASQMDVADLRPHLTTRVGDDALLHLVRVTSGLDSLVVGEEQIRGQVREALRSAEAAHTLPASLRGPFQRASESARRIRGATRLGQTPSIASAGVSVARRALGRDISGELAVVLGAGVMARAAAEALLAAGARVRVLNRTPAHAERLMSNLHGRIEVDSLHALRRALAEATLVVGATASREPVVNLADVEAAAHDLVLLDIALPRDVDPRLRELPSVTLIDLDDLERLCPVDVSTRRAERQQAEALAIEEAERLAEWLRLRAISPAIAELRTYAEGIRTDELRRSAARLRNLTPDQSAAVEALTSSIVNKLMHGPTVALREAASRRGELGRSRSRIMGVIRTAKTRRRSA